MITLPPVSISNYDTSNPVQLNGPYQQVTSTEFAVPGPSGKSAYQIAVDNGFVGTQAEWLASLATNATSAGMGYWVLKADSATTFPARSTIPAGWTSSVQYDSTQYPNHPDPVDMQVGDQHLKRNS